MTDASTPCPASMGTQMGFVGAIRLLYAAALPCFVAVVVSSTVALANVPVALRLDSPPEPARQLPALDPLPESLALAPAASKAVIRARVRTRCEACGVVEAIRRIDAVGNLPPAYEFTVRLRDGSTRLSTDASQAKWRAGDQIMLIGGFNAAGQ